jgi:hypothetical protein
MDFWGFEFATYHPSGIALLEADYHRDAGFDVPCIFKLARRDNILHVQIEGHACCLSNSGFLRICGPCKFHLCFLEIARVVSGIQVSDSEWVQNFLRKKVLFLFVIWQEIDRTNSCCTNSP